MFEKLYERFCRRCDDWQLAHPKPWWTWWRCDTAAWSPYQPWGRKVYDEAGNLMEGDCMRRFHDGRWVYRPFDEDEAENDRYWTAIR